MENKSLYIPEHGQSNIINILQKKSFSFVVVDLNLKIDLAELLQFADSNYNNYEIIYCSTKCNKQHECLKFFKFATNVKVDEILNSVINECWYENIVVIRQIDDFIKLKTITDSLTNDNQIAYFKKDISKKNFAYKILNKVASKLFAHKIVPIDLSIVGYSKMPTLVLKQLNAPSNILRLNNWVGVERVELSGGGICKMEYSKKRYIIPLVCNLLAFVVPIVLLSVGIKMDFLLKMLLSLLCLVGGLMSFIIAINWFVKSQIGENNFNKAKILNKGEDINEKN